MSDDKIISFQGDKAVMRNAFSAIVCIIIIVLGVIWAQSIVILIGVVLFIIDICLLYSYMTKVVLVLKQKSLAMAGRNGEILYSDITELIHVHSKVMYIMIKSREDDLKITLPISGLRQSECERIYEFLQKKTGLEIKGQQFYSMPIADELSKEQFKKEKSRNEELTSQSCQVVYKDNSVSKFKRLFIFSGIMFLATLFMKSDWLYFFLSFSLIFLYLYLHSRNFVFIRFFDDHLRLNVNGVCVAYKNICEINNNNGSLNITAYYKGVQLLLPMKSSNYKKATIEKIENLLRAQVDGQTNEHKN